MTERNPMEGTKRLYDEDVTPRNSLAFNIGMVILGKIFKGIGTGIDKGLDALGIGKYFAGPGKEGQPGYQTGYIPAPVIASGYRTALTREVVPVRIENSYGTRAVYGRWAE